MKTTILTAILLFSANVATAGFPGFVGGPQAVLEPCNINDVARGRPMPAGVPVMDPCAVEKGKPVVNGVPGGIIDDCNTNFRGRPAPMGIPAMPIPNPCGNDIVDGEPVLEGEPIICDQDLSRGRPVPAGVPTINPCVRPIDPADQNNQEEDLGVNSAIIASLLLDTQLKDCVAEYQEHDVALDKVTSQTINATLTRYKLSGAILLGGDVVVGNLTMEINEIIGSANSLADQIPVTRTCTVSVDL